MFNSEFLHTLDERGFIHQISDAVGCDALFTNGGVPAYIGFDPTASSLHVGSLMQIMILHWLKKTNNVPIVVLGGATGLVGDPSFKNAARSMLDEDTVGDNIRSIRNIFEQVLGPNTIIENNATWIDQLDLMTFLRKVGVHFNVNQMLSFDSVKSRMGDGQSLSLLEFCYMTLQAFDFVALNDKHGVRVQLGGSDQWGNIINGINLGHKMNDTQLFGITSPLLVNANGGKMGKTVNGAVWINEDKLNNFDFWQFWRNVDDRDVHKFLKFFTEIPVSEIDALVDANHAKILLADKVTEFVRGETSAIEAKTAAEAAFNGGDIDSLPTVEAETNDVCRILVQAKLVKSVSEARRLIAGNGVRVNGELITDQAMTLSSGTHKISMGKKKHIRAIVNA